MMQSIDEYVYEKCSKTQSADRYNNIFVQSNLESNAFSLRPMSEPQECARSSGLRCNGCLEFWWTAASAAAAVIVTSQLLVLHVSSF